jgi:hypothetical protein
MTILSIEEWINGDDESDAEYERELEARFNRRTWLSLWRTFRWVLLAGAVITVSWWAL